MYFVCLFVFLLLLTFSFYLFLFFVRVKICLLNPTQNVVSSIFEEWYLEKSGNHDVNCLFLFFFVFLHSTPPACGQSTSPTVNQIPTTLQRIRPRQAHLVCSTDATEVTQKAPPSSFFPPIDNFSLSLLLLAAWLDLIYETKCAFAGWLKQSFGTSIKSHLMSYECRNLSTSPRLTFTTARIIIGAGKLTLTWWCQGWLWIFLFFFCLYECTMTRTSHI